MPGAATGVCVPAQSSDPLPARTTITSGVDAGSQSETYLTSDLFGQFKSICGGCHVESSLGNFSVTASTFPNVVDQTVLDIIKSDVSTVYMPPAGSPNAMPFSQRATTDPVYQLASLLDQWISAGRPISSFVLQGQTTMASEGYAMTAALGAGLTNIGSCIPPKSMVGASTSAMDQLDAFFSSATALPPTLDQTDLTTLDSSALAKTGVISYAPTYPLWSDNAGKMRYIRVPRGQSVKFDAATQTFTIPPNTRFYKTFLKEVVDANGNSTYRKIETRVIVSRPDTTASDGTAQQNALFGTYVWNKDESQAELSSDPLRDGRPFADRVFTYITDEKKDQEIIASKPFNLPSAENTAGITRHYGLPGSERCIQCHMGSPSQSFVLGFTPLQVARRATGEGGTYEAASADELTQLQRMIDYGVISGMSSPSDVLPLELSEGSRVPRNAHELAAQAYMVGNCAHCHNPRGFPSIKQPELKDVLRFLPGAGSNDGIFQFPLDRFSPVRKRGLLQNVPIPYITPSLYDIPSDSVTSKYFCPDEPQGACGGAASDQQWILAPWRSLIYRNTDTPYDYFDDYTPFPHMPLNTSGYDCRVAKLMGDWMVSIPARVKSAVGHQAAFPVNGSFVGADINADPQPYEEALPGDSDYAAAVGSAAVRLSQYHNSFRYSFCPSTYTADIVDPVTADQVNQGLPVESDLGFGFYDPTNPDRMIMPQLAPVRPDYISFDDTDPPGDWFPRRPDWATALVNPDIQSFVDQVTMIDTLSPDAAEDLTNVLTALESVTLTADIRTALLQQYPFGLWDTTVSGCNFSGVPTVASFTGASRPQWMDVVSPAPAPSAPVFMETPGAAIFTTVCFNCHGVNADSKGLLADEITNLTGGDARVANFRDGFLGPVSAPGTNRDNVFGPAATTLGVTADDLAARYMAWMALGGTEKHLPEDVLTEVSLSPVLGQIRAHMDLQGTPDMLRLGLTLCEQIVGSDMEGTQYNLGQFIATGRMGWSDESGLIDSNGDAENWLRLCNLGNRAIVRVPVIPGGWGPATSATQLTVSGYRLFWAADSTTGADLYGANPVMDHRGNLATGVTPDNLFPICVQKPTDPTQLQYANAALKANPVAGKNVFPFCPDGFIQTSNQLAVDTSGVAPDFIDGKKWAARGAINAALAVFLYLDQMERDPSKKQVLYTQCNLIGSAK
jgi:mono/diheme cytochrome c family protein